MSEPSNDRLVALELSRRQVVDILAAHFNLPPDVHVDSVFSDPWTKRIVITLAHTTFARVPEYEVIPRVQFTLRDLDFARLLDGNAETAA